MASSSPFSSCTVISDRHLRLGHYHHHPCKDEAPTMFIIVRLRPIPRYHRHHRWHSASRDMVLTMFNIVWLRLGVVASVRITITITTIFTICCDELQTSQDVRVRRVARASHNYHHHQHRHESEGHVCCDEPLPSISPLSPSLSS